MHTCTYKLRRFLHKHILVFPEGGAIGIARQHFHLEVPLFVSPVVSNRQLLLQFNLQMEYIVEILYNTIQYYTILYNVWKRLTRTIASFLYLIH